MTRTSSILPAALLALVPLASAVAQDGPPAGVHMESVVIVGDAEGGGAMWAGGSSEDLHRDLDLNDAQRGKIDGILKEAGEAVRARVAEAHGKGNWLAVAPEIAKIKADATAKVKAELTPAQREQYEKRAAARNPMRAFGGAPVLNRLGHDDSPFSPASRVERAMEGLRIADAAEAEAVKALVVRVVGLQDELAGLDRSHREKTDGLLRSDGLKDEPLAQRLEAFRAERKRIEESLRAAQAELGQVVSVRQEAVLFRHGVLR